MYHHVLRFFTEGVLVTFERRAPMEGLNAATTGDLGITEASAGKVRFIAIFISCSLEHQRI